MSRYYFTLGDGQVYDDPEGEELADIAAARVVATKYLCDMLRSKIDQLWDDGAMYVTVTDEHGSEVLKLAVAVSSHEHGRGSEVASTGRHQIQPQPTAAKTIS